MTSPAEMNGVFFGSYDVALHPRVAVLRDGLADNGWSVREINSPLGLSTADKVDAAGSIAGSVRLLIGIIKSWFALWRGSRGVPTPDLVVVGYLGHFDIHLARLRWPKAQIALDHLVGLADTARDRGLAGGLKYRLLDTIDRAALRKADVVVVDTQEQLEQLPDQAQARAVVIPVGATSTWFQQGNAPPFPPLRVCFVGLFTPLHGAEVIGRAMERLADDDRIEFTMVGSGQDLEATRRAAAGARVRWIDWVPSDELPELVGSQHVCLGIFGTTPKAQRVVPTKVYQGLAAGNIVVTSDTVAQRRALGDAALYVAPGDDEALAACLARIADDPTSVQEGAPQRRATAEMFTPKEVVRPLVERRTTMTSSEGMSAGPALPANAWLRFDLLRPTLENLKPSRVVEIGPGQGAIAARLVAAGHDYTGIEMSESARVATTELLSRYGTDRYRLVSSLEELDGDNGFDLLCAFEVLEHIEDDEGALTEWVRHLRPGATVLLSVPAWPERFSDHDTEVGHLRRYTPDQLRSVAQAAGLVDIDVRVYGFPLGLGLEQVRNTMARRIQRRNDVGSETALERTERSGSWHQPPRWANSAFRMGTWPFRILQRRFPDRGTGLVMRARTATEQ